MTGSADGSLDGILLELGDFGKYQSLVFSLVCFAVVLHSATHIAYVFTAMDLDYRCEVPDCDTKNSSFLDDWTHFSVPYNKDGKPAKCERYVRSANASHSSGNCSEDSFQSHRTETCSSFRFKTDEISILKDYNLTCNENLWKLTLVGTMNNIGQFFGLFLSGLISDRFGRRVVLVWGLVFCGVCGIIRSFMPTYELFLLFEFLDAVFGAGVYICGFVLGIELVGPKNRVLTGTLNNSCYAIGEIFVAGAAWLVKSWKPLIYIIYSPLFLVITYIWLVPESVRWQLSKGRLEEAKASLRYVAKVNGKTLSEETLEKLELVQYEELKNVDSPFAQVFKSKTLLLRLINCCICWITCTFLFYGLTLTSVTLAGNNYLDFILTSLVEIPAYIACNYAIELLGRKKSLIASYLITGTACLVFNFMPASEWGSLSVYLIGKFGATAAFTVLYVVTSEVFPTSLRHTLMGFCSTFGRIGSMIAPQTPLLSQLWTPLPLISFSVMSLIAALLSFNYPETVNKKLPDTVEEAVNLGKEESSKT